MENRKYTKEEKATIKILIKNNKQILCERIINGDLMRSGLFTQSKILQDKCNKMGVDLVKEKEITNRLETQINTYKIDFNNNLRDFKEACDKYHKAMSDLKKEGELTIKLQNECDRLHIEKISDLNLIKDLTLERLKKG